MLTRLIRANSLIIRTISIRTITDKTTNEVLTKEITNGGVITLNRPEKLNALNADMMRSIYENLKKMENSKSLVIIKGAGGKAFCAGGDAQTLIGLGPTYVHTLFHELYTLFNLIGNYKIPYIAIIEGITMGAGFAISAYGKYRVASEKTIFAVPETAIGIFPGSSYFLSRINGKFGLYLALTGVRLKGKDVNKIGIASHFCDSTKIPELENALLTCKTSNEVNLVLRKFCPENNSEFSLEKYLAKINDCFSASTVEGIIRKLKNYGSNWADSTVEILEKMCPTSLKVTYRQMEAASSLNFAQCLQMEHRIMVRCGFDHDFREGVRAILVEKTNNPIWNPSKLTDVKEQRVQLFFDKLPVNEELVL